MDLQNFANGYEPQISQLAPKPSYNLELAFYNHVLPRPQSSVANSHLHPHSTISSASSSFVKSKRVLNRLATFGHRHSKLMHHLAIIAPRPCTVQPTSGTHLGQVFKPFIILPNEPSTSSPVSCHQENFPWQRTIMLSAAYL
jgi:hypothetical protein